MKDLWSIRMRASRNVKCQKSKVKCQNLKLETRNSKLAEVHISGAEGLYEASEIQRVVRKYSLRALNHPKGLPDKIVITIENIKQSPEVISALPVATVNSSTPAEGRNIAIKLLQSLGISSKAIDRAFELIKKGSMRGAAIVTAEKGNRLEPDRGRGVRASRLGINKSALKVLSLRLSRHGINTDTVKEALILASKVASCKHVIAELCVSDDPYYTTGYVASKGLGYLRIPNIKKRGSKRGGRAFFVNEGINVEGIINYLERTPVIIGKVALCKGIMSIDEIINRPYQ
ncbi:MAG: 6-carboxyhexanoate--CoA ligase [Nitrospirota bacterium]